MAIGSGTAAAITLIGAGASAAASVRNANLQEEAQRLQQRRADSQAAVERRNVIREDRIRRAQLINASAQQGTQGSSSEASALSGLSSQTGFNITQSFAQQNLSNRISGNLQTSANINTASNIFSTIGNTANIFATP